MRNEIRPANLLDLLPLTIPPAAELRLDLARQLVSPHHLLRGLLASWLRPREPFCTLLLWGERGLLAGVQARARPQNASWGVYYLAAWPAGRDAATVHWEDLLLGLSVEAGRNQVTRLLAYLPSEEHLGLFQRAGFTPFAEEMVLILERETRIEAQAVSALQPVQPQDLWAVQQLYLRLTPPIVQQAEGGSGDSWQPQRGETGWIWQEDGQVRAYLRRWCGPHGTRLDLLLDPAHRRHAAALLSQALLEATYPAYLILRSYQGELLEVARRLGFRQFAEQFLLGKYLAVPQEQRQPLRARQGERSLGTAPTAPSVGKVRYSRESYETVRKST